MVNLPLNMHTRGDSMHHRFLSLYLMELFQSDQKLISMVMTLGENLDAALTKETKRRGLFLVFLIKMLTN